MMVHSALTRSIPACLSVIGAACLLSACQPETDGDVLKTKKAYREMVQVRSCVSGVYVYRDPQGKLWSGWPNTFYVRERLPEGATPETYCQ